MIPELSWVIDKIQLRWVSGDSNVDGNQQADELASIGKKIYRIEETGSTKPQIKLLEDSKIQDTIEIIGEQHDERSFTEF